MHRKAQAVGLTGPVVGILAQQQHLHLFIGGEMERREYVVVGWEHLILRAFLMDKLLQLSPIRLGEFRPEDRVPISGGHNRWILGKFLTVAPPERGKQNLPSSRCLTGRRVVE